MEEQNTNTHDVEFSVEHPAAEQAAGGQPAMETVQVQSAPEQMQAMSADGQPQSQQGSILGDKTLEDVIQREAVEEQDTTLPFSISRTLGGVIIARFVQKQMGLVLLICFFLIVYISLRYRYQQQLVEIDRMEAKLVEARYKAIVCTSILTEKSRESNIMHLLNSYGDSALVIPQDPPYLIKVPEEE